MLWILPWVFYMKINYAQRSMLLYKVEGLVQIPERQILVLTS